MIYIKLSNLGLATEASCAIPREHGGEDTFSEIFSTGAKALTALVEKLGKEYAGQPWIVSHDPKISGVVPARKYRKPTRSRKATAVQLRWC